MTCVTVALVRNVNNLVCACVCVTARQKSTDEAAKGLFLGEGIFDNRHLAWLPAWILIRISVKATSLQIFTLARIPLSR